MGALLQKHSSSRYRVWNLSTFKVDNYLEFNSDKFVFLYTFQNRPVRVLPNTNWISDRIRFSYDGLHRQRLTAPYFNGQQCNFSFAASKLFSLISSKDVFLHFGMVELNSVYPVYKLLKLLSSSLVAPYIDIFRNSNDISSRLKDRNSLIFNDSIKNIAPALLDAKAEQVNTEKNLSLINSGRWLPPVDQNFSELLTEGVGQTSVIPVIQGVSINEDFYISDSVELSRRYKTVVFIQTEQLTVNKDRSEYDTIYFGTHGFVNANRFKLLLPTLLTYERKTLNIKNVPLNGPKNARSLFLYSSFIFQILSKAAVREKQALNVKPLNQIDERLIVCKLSDSFRDVKKKSNYLYFNRLPPELIISNIQQCLTSY